MFCLGVFCPYNSAAICPGANTPIAGGVAGVAGTTGIVVPLPLAPPPFAAASAWMSASDMFCSCERSLALDVAASSMTGAAVGAVAVAALFAAPASPGG